MIGFRTFLKLIILCITIYFVDSTYLISVSDNITTNQSESVVLSCKAYNNLTAQVYLVAWLRSGVVITERKLLNSENLKQFVDENDIHRYTIQGLPVSDDVTDYRLGIKDLKKEDIDNYACSLCRRYVSSYDCVNPLEIVENLPVELDVMYTPKQPECSVLEKTSLGADITVECISGEGKPRVDLKFTVDGELFDDELTMVPLPENGMLKITQSFRVTEDNIGKEIGCYSTSQYFTNFIGSCKHGTITVQDTPEVSLTSSLEFISVGDSVSYTCFAKSRSDIKYFDWTTNPKSVKDRMVINTDLSAMTSTIMLHEVLFGDDQTRVNCIVANKAGEIETASALISTMNSLMSSRPTATLETTNTASNKTRENLEESNIGFISGVILTVIVLIVIGGIAGYLLFVRRRKDYKEHKPVPLNETSSTIKCDESWNKNEDVNQTEKLKIWTDNNLNDYEQNANTDVTKETQKEQSYAEELNDEEDDVFIGVTEILPVPTHV